MKHYWAYPLIVLLIIVVAVGLFVPERFVTIQEVGNGRCLQTTTQEYMFGLYSRDVQVSVACDRMLTP